MTAILRGSVLAPTLPDQVWVVRRDSLLGNYPIPVGHEPGCREAPAAAVGTSVPGAHAWRFVAEWCPACFPGKRYRRRVVDSFGRYAGRCGQPSGDGPECRHHHNEDVTEDKRLERAA